MNTPPAKRDVVRAGALRRCLANGDYTPDHGAVEARGDHPWGYLSSDVVENRGEHRRRVDDERSAGSAGVRARTA